ncbi:MAG: S16 family serine protease [Dermatophilaceae bacterium]
MTEPTRDAAPPADLAGVGGAPPDAPGIGAGVGQAQPEPASRSLVRLVVGLALAFALGAAVSLIHVPYAILGPGPATDVLGQERGSDGAMVDRIVISDAPTFRTSGSLDFTTVRVRGGPGYAVNIVDVLVAWLARDEDVYPVDELFPPQVTREQVAEENRVEMAGSQQVAAAVAVRATGRQVPEVIKITGVLDKAPSAGELKAGDVLVSIAGGAVTDGGALRAAIQRVPAGEAVEMVVQRDGTEVTVHPRTGRADDGRTILGIMLAVEYRMPFTVKVDAGNVGGPSAGLMFALGIYDKLTAGAMTGGVTIAGTGTIDDAGTVGPIGGIAQKMVGAREAGATFFLAPAANCPDVLGREPAGMTVVKIGSFAEATAAVTAIGRSQAAALPHC